MADKGQKLRILSLDGGGFRELSSLLILQEMMDMIRIAEGRPAKDEPCPCDHFEYITGTGIGGVIALLLGRLQLPISKCILAYRELSSQVLRDNGYSPLFDMGKFLGAAKRIIGNYGARMGETDPKDTAETIVFAVEKEKGPRCIYSEDKELSDLDPETPLHELFAALMAAKGLLREYPVKDRLGHDVTFLDGPYPLGHHNSAVEAVCGVAARERKKQQNNHWLRNAVLVSIGTGRVAKDDIGDLALLGSMHGWSWFDLAKPWKHLGVAQDLAHAVTASLSPEQIISSIDRRQQRIEHDIWRVEEHIPHGVWVGHTYTYRFEIGPVSGVVPNDFRSVKEVGDKTDGYLKDSHQGLQELVAKIVGV